jgi:hypothetical protein
VAINEIWKAGCIHHAIDKGNSEGWHFYEYVKNNVPFIIGCSMRDDGPLPDTIPNVLQAQDEMRKHV